MKTLFFDCTNGISGDMILKALMELSGRLEAIEEALKGETLRGYEHNCERHAHDHHHAHDHDQHHNHDHDHHTHGRSWLKVKELINHSSFSDAAKATALSIYQNIAEAEAAVHGETLETIHFHEVGRDEAIKNALGIGMALAAIESGSPADCPEVDRVGGQGLEILTSTIYDGKGTVVCSHGEIPVPVPAVQALMQKCSYTFETADVDTEMVTPSGLASLMGIGAKPSDKTLQQLLEREQAFVETGDQSVGVISPEPRVRIIAQAEVKGSRDTGRDGLRAYLIEVDATSGAADRFTD